VKKEKEQRARKCLPRRLERFLLFDFLFFFAEKEKS